MKRPWNRSEKFLLITPLLLAVAVWGIWQWRQRAPVIPIFIKLPQNASLQYLEFSPDGKRLVVFSNGLFKGQNYLEVYDAYTSKKVCDLVCPRSPVIAPNPRFFTSDPYFEWPSWSPDGTRIVAGYDDGSKGTKLLPNPNTYDKKQSLVYNTVGKIALWDARSGMLNGNWLYSAPNIDSYSKVRFSSDGQTLVGYGKPVATFNATTGQQLTEEEIKENEKKEQKIAPHQKLGVTVVKDDKLKQLKVVDTRTGRVQWQPQVNWSDNPNYPFIEKFSHQWFGDVLGVKDAVEYFNPKTQNKDSLAQWQLWDARTQSRLSLPLKPNQSVLGLAMSSDQNTFAFYSNQREKSPPNKPFKNSGEFVMWNYKQNRVITRIPTQSRWLWLQWSPDGKWVSVVEEDTEKTGEYLLIFDKSGKMRFKRPCANIIHRWAPDSTRIAFPSLNNRNSIEILRVAD